MKKKDLSCTSILIGKDATIDGSTIIARNEDYYAAVGPKTFVVRPAKDVKDNLFESPITHVKIPLPDHAYRYTCEPSPCELELEELPSSDTPVYEEAGVNEKNVAMSATETTFTNPRFLGFDPLVENAINEDSMLTIVLPYINSAREGVKRLGALIEKYGTGQSNGISFSDKDEIWYLETAGGHNWAAVRIPDDAYVIAPNQTSIQEIKFDDPDNYLSSTNLKKFVEQNHLNDNPTTFNFRNIAGTHTEWDRHYNTPRKWYGQLLYSKDDSQEPTSDEIPFARKPYRKLSVEDAEYFLSSHYQGTKYDPLKNPAEYEHPTFRPIAIDRNEISHIIQIRNDVDPKYAALEWVAMGFFCYSPYVPFFTNISDTPSNYQIANAKPSHDSAYWMFKNIAALAEPHYDEVGRNVDAYRDECQSYAIQRIQKIDKQAKNLNGTELTQFLTDESIKTADKITQKTRDFTGELIIDSLNLSKMKFE